MSDVHARVPLLLASVFGAAGVALGAFGAHALSGHFEANPSLQATYETAVQYHLIHAAALLGTAALAAWMPSKWVRRAAWLFALGILLFSGSLYILSLANLRFMGAVAPFGGAALIAGWVSLGIGAWKINIKI
ncbi:MAG: DUF423 domain-containing protein [Anaerolineae bacterium]|nr:DUF423 domain-containing protein [Anaerolineae bacterium]